MKRVVLAALVLLLLLASLAPVQAETADGDAFAADRKAARWGVAMTVGLIGNACDHLEDAAMATIRSNFYGFTNIDFLLPDKVIVIDLTDEEIETARAALSAESGDELASALAEYVNRQFDDEYAEAVNAVAHRYGNTTVERGLVVLPYGWHIAVVSFQNRKAQSALVISTKEISQALDAESIGQYTSQLGLGELPVRIYAGADRDELLYGNEWKSGAAYMDSEYHMADQIGKTADRFLRLFPLTMRENTIDDGLRFYILRCFLEDAARGDPMGAARIVAERALPLMRLSDPEVTTRFVRENQRMIDAFRDSRKAPDIPYGDTLQEGDPDMRGTFLYVITLNSPERESESFCDLVLEATLPAANIPDTPEKADYIIRCNVTYSETPDASNSTSAIYCPTTEITLHDARTGAMLQNLGTVTRELRKGIIVATKGNTYYYPFIDQIWEKTRVLFEKD